jgi:hypothetical protein
MDHICRRSRVQNCRFNREFRDSRFEPKATVQPRISPAARKAAIEIVATETPPLSRRQAPTEVVRRLPSLASRSQQMNRGSDAVTARWQSIAFSTAFYSFGYEMKEEFIILVRGHQAGSRGLSGKAPPQSLSNSRRERSIVGQRSLRRVRRCCAVALSSSERSKLARVMVAPIT